jgi:hypothetical protein
VAFVHPGDTFVALAALVTFYPVFRGTLDLIVALSAGGVMPGPVAAGDHRARRGAARVLGRRFAESTRAGIRRIATGEAAVR